MSAIPRLPIKQEQRFDNDLAVYVLDWDDQWWRFGGWWERVNVRRNLLLQPYEGSASLDSLAETSNGEST